MASYAEVGNISSLYTSKSPLQLTYWHPISDDVILANFALSQSGAGRDYSSSICGFYGQIFFQIKENSVKTQTHPMSTDTNFSVFLMFSVDGVRKKNN